MAHDSSLHRLRAGLPAGPLLFKMKRIALTKGKFALVDDEDFQRVMRHGWIANRSIQGRWYAVAQIKQRRVYLQRFILGTPEGMDTDHINGDTFDNRKSNLRVCRHSQNCANGGKRGPSRSGFKGVTRDPNGWRAQITVHRKCRYLGFSTDPVVCAKLYDRAAIEHFGEFAVTNQKLGLLPA